MTLRFKFTIYCTGNKAWHIAYTIGSRKTVPPRKLRIVPLGLGHIFFRLNSAQWSYYKKIRYSTNENCQIANPSHEPHPA